MPPMITRCVMCAAEIDDGILCAKCDGPLRSASSSANPTGSPDSASRIHVSSPETGSAEEIQQVLEAANAAALVFESSGRLVSMTRDAREILRYGPGERPGTLEIETRLGMKVTRLDQTSTSSTTIGGVDYTISTVLLGGGSSGRVVVLRSNTENHEDVELAFFRETVIGPLKSLNSTLKIAARQRGSDHLLNDAISTIDQALSSLELSPELSGGLQREPAFLVLETIKARYEPTAQSKGVDFRVENTERDLEIEDVRGVSNAIGIYLENSLRYVPRGGQVVVGVRRLEHKGNPLHLFFVMDNGPIIPAEKREAIFSPDYRPAANSTTRTAVRFAEVRGYAISRGGKAWMEAKTGKACTFFLSLPG